MAQDKGFVKINRNILDNALWNEKPYDKAHAFVDLILLCAWSEKTLVIGGEKVTLMPGQYFTSLRVLAERWGWTRSKVNVFLKELDNKHSCEHFTNTYGTLITLVNWASYQSSTSSNKHFTNTSCDKIKNNIKEIKNYKEKYKKKGGIIHSSYDFEALEDFINEESLK